MGSYSMREYLKQVCHILSSLLMLSFGRYIKQRYEFHWRSVSYRATCRFPLPCKPTLIFESLCGLPNKKKNLLFMNIGIRNILPYNYFQ
jgi:hypothetical protein